MGVAGGDSCINMYVYVCICVAGVIPVCRGVCVCVYLGAIPVNMKLNLIFPVKLSHVI